MHIEIVYFKAMTRISQSIKFVHLILLGFGFIQLKPDESNIFWWPYRFRFIKWTADSKSQTHRTRTDFSWAKNYWHSTRHKLFGPLKTYTHIHMCSWNIKWVVTMPCIVVVGFLLRRLIEYFDNIIRNLDVCKV